MFIHRLLFMVAVGWCNCTVPAGAQTAQAAAHNHARVDQGKIVVHHFVSAAIRDNAGGEDPKRRLSVYLPPSYERDGRRYPVVYFLHGFYVDDSLIIAYTQFKKLLDDAIRAGAIKPLLVVFPNSDTRFKGSFYTNSSLTGNWAEYIGHDVVAYVDQHFRTIPNRNSRGVAGHSMGGNGAIKMGMLYPDVFGAVYALSPAFLAWAGDFTVRSPAMKRAVTATREEQVVERIRWPLTAESATDLLALACISMARSYSPNAQHEPFSANFPMRLVGDSMRVDEAVVKQWEANFPLNMVDSHLPALKQLNALKMDWGHDDESSHIPITCWLFSKKLAACGIPHMAEEYNGQHHDKLDGPQGRFYTDMFPFFNTVLSTETSSRLLGKKK